MSSFGTILKYYNALWSDHNLGALKKLLDPACTLTYDILDDSPTTTYQGRGSIMSEWYRPWFRGCLEGSTEVVSFDIHHEKESNVYHVWYTIYYTYIEDFRTVRYMHKGNEYITLNQSNNRIVHNKVICTEKREV